MPTCAHMHTCAHNQSHENLHENVLFFQELDIFIFDFSFVYLFYEYKKNKSKLNQCELLNNLFKTSKIAETKRITKREKSY